MKDKNMTDQQWMLRGLAISFSLAIFVGLVVEVFA